MDSQLQDDLRDFVRQEVAEGRYETPLEVIEAALRQMMQRDARVRKVRQQFRERDVDNPVESQSQW